ncbi:MAG: twin-arginine translocation signal domain-containing protein, partial [Planctomycetota bacterium]
MSKKRVTPSRRDFLGAAALAAGGLGLAANAQRPAARPIVRAKPALARPKPPRSSESTRIAIIGTGGMGRAHLSSIL